MPFLCYIHRRTGGVPHFEVLPDGSPAAAAARAATILAQRPDSDRAELWQDDLLLLTLPGLSRPAA
jgi:hypothetical protein